jgi:hypothetical protein
VVHLVSREERYVTYLKKLRKDMAIDHVPIMVYRVLPDHGDVQRILMSISDTPGVGQCF